MTPALVARRVIVIGLGLVLVVGMFAAVRHSRQGPHGQHDGGEGGATIPKDRTFGERLLGKWKDRSSTVTITFERDTAILQEGFAGGLEVPYEVNPQGRVATFKMPDAKMLVTARMGDDGTLRFQTSGRPGELLILHRAE